MRKSESHPDLLLQAASQARLFLDERGEPYARVRDPAGPRLLRLHGHEFRVWLCSRCHDLSGQVIGAHAVSATLLLLEERARRAPRVLLWNRVGRDHGGAIWLDLGEGRAARVTSAGFEVSHDPPALFRRFSHQASLPDPAATGDLRRMNAFLNLQDADDEVLFYTSLVAALICDIPQPLLILHGPQGSAKTTTARLRRHLIDPSRLSTVMMRHEVGELVQVMDHHYMPVLDNLTRLSPWQADMLCQAATGGGFTKRALFTDQDDVMFRFCRPVVLTAINPPSAAPDLLDRAILIGLERISATGRRDERALWRAYEAARPGLLGGLLGALAEALRIERGLVLPELSRMADFSRYGAAAAEALGYGAERFVAALERNGERQGEEVAGADPVAAAVQELVLRGTEFAGTATELLAALVRVAGSGDGLPRRGAELGKRLVSLRAPLRQIGIAVEFERRPGGNRERRWVVRAVPQPTQPASASAQPTSASAQPTPASAQPVPGSAPPAAAAPPG